MAGQRTWDNVESGSWWSGGDLPQTLGAFQTESWWSCDPGEHTNES